MISPRLMRSHPKADSKRVRLGGRSSATPRGKGSQELALQVSFDYAIYSFVGARSQLACNRRQLANEIFSEKLRLATRAPRRNCDCALRGRSHKVNHASLHHC